MNITRTNMLLLDNKIKKDDDTDKKTSSAQVPTIVEPQAGMKALMFKGMQNLMANPSLAKSAGIMNGEEEGNKNDSVQLNQTHVSFKGGKVFKTLTMAALIATGAALSSCGDKTEIYSSPTKIENHNTVNVDLKGIVDAVNGLQNTVYQLYLLGKISQEDFRQYMKDTEAWRQQTSADLNAIKAILNTIANNTFEIKSSVDAIYNENNVFHKSVVDMLSKVMTKEEAIALFNQAYAEVVSGNKSAADAYAELIKLAQERNAKLDTIIGKMDAAYEQRETQIEVLRKMQATGEATEEAVQAIKSNTAETNNILREQGVAFLNQLKLMDCHTQNGINLLAQQNNCSTQQIIKAMGQLGIKIDNNTDAIYWTGDRLAGALAVVDQSINNQTNAINGFRGDFNNFAGYALNVLEGIDYKVGAGVQILVQHANNVNSAFNRLQGSVDYANMSLAYIANNTDVIKENTANIEGILYVISKDIKSIDNSVKTIEELAAHWGITKEDLMEAVCYLGYSLSEVQTWNADRIIEVLQNSFNEQNELIGANGEKLDKLAEIACDILKSTNQYFRAAVNAFGNFNKLGNEIKSILCNVNCNVSTLVSEQANMSAQLADLYTAVTAIQDLVAKLKTCDHDGMTAAEFKLILQQQHQEDYQFLIQLINDYNIGSQFDSKPIEDLLAEISCKLDYQRQGNEILAKIFELMAKFPDKMDEIKQAIIDKQFIFNCCCQGDCDHDDDVHEGIQDDLGIL